MYQIQLQDAKDQIQAKIDEQKDMEQEHQRLEKEIAAATEALEAKRAKKRKWKEQCMAHDSATAALRDELKDKQFAVEKAMQRFKALEARIEAGTQLSKEQETEQPREAQDEGKADWEAKLARQQAECTVLSGKLQAAREVHSDLNVFCNVEESFLIGLCIDAFKFCHAGGR